MRLEPLLNPELAVVIERELDKTSVLRLLVEHAKPELPAVDTDELVELLAERERKLPTSTPEGVAFPHAMLPEIDGTVVVPMLVRPGVPFGVETHPPSDMIFGMFGSADRPYSHVRLLARLSRIARGSGALDRFRAAESGQALHSMLLDEDRKHG